MNDKWQLITLGEVCDIGAGNSAPQIKELFDGGENLFFRTSDVGKIRFGVIKDSADKLNASGIRKLHLHKKGTLLFPKSGASTFLNHRVLMGRDGYVSSHLATLKANNNILDDEYLLYFSSTIDSRTLMQDQNYPSLRLSDIQSINILLPPLSEQKKIVKLLNQVFDGAEKAKENAEKNLQNARELFKSYLNNIFAKSKNNWEEKKLGAICEVITKGTTPTSINHYFVNEGINFIKVESIGLNGIFIPNKFAHITENCQAVLKRSQLQKGDILFSIAGALGRVAVVTDNILPANTNQALCIIRLGKSNDISAEFVSKILGTGLVLEQIEKCRGGVAQQNLSLAQVSNFRIPLPPISEQKQIVAKLDAFSTQTMKFEAIYLQKITDLEELKKSILHKAFNGELTGTKQ